MLAKELVLCRLAHTVEETETRLRRSALKVVPILCPHRLTGICWNGSLVDTAKEVCYDLTFLK